ncbi:MAG: hypothetical protein HQ510_11060 [Candidatus Marinimicrobia bacterium]|nr:hypothetical protein [Candidatus Neomarinimicrobiota bacterium]
MSSNKKNENDLVRKFLELDKQENEIKQRRAILRKQKAWYLNPSNIIGILTIIVTISITVFTT